MRKLFLLFFASILMLAPLAVAHAGFLDQANRNLEGAVGKVGFAPSLETSISTVIKAALSLVGTIFFILTIYAGIVWMTAMGEEEKVTRAQKTITAAVIGLVVTLAAYAITAFVTSALGGSGGEPAGEPVGCCVITKANGEVQCGLETQVNCLAATQSSGISGAQFPGGTCDVVPNCP